MFKFKKSSQKGSVFTVLLAGVAMAGTLSVILYQVISGPMASVVRVSNKTAAKNQLQSISNIIIMDAINFEKGGDCDSDDFVEPREWQSKGTNDAPTNGGLIPTDIGAPLTDPWGTNYGYCVWDVGNKNDPHTDNGCGVDVNRLSGSPDPTAGKSASQTVLAVISAGPNRVFESTCKDYVDEDTSVLDLGGDDFIQQYTYKEAATATSSLWKLSSSDPNVAEIDKNITVGTPTTNDTLTDTSGVIRALAVITQGLVQVGGALRLADENAVTDCTTAGDLRYNSDDAVIEVCDGTDWVASSGGGGTSVKGFTEGSVPFVNDEEKLDEDNANLFWNRTDLQLTVGKRIKFKGDTGSKPNSAAVSLDMILSDMSDVNITNPTANDALIFNGTYWVNGTPVLDMAEIADANITNPADKEILEYDNGKWVNVPKLWTEDGSDIYYDTGNVGIGTGAGNINDKLVVAGSVRANAFYDRDNIAFYVDPSSSSYLTNVYATYMGISSSGLYGINVSNDASNGIAGYFSSSNGYAIVTGAGNVGIGTNTPRTALEVAGIITAGDAIRLANETVVTSCTTEAEGDLRYNSAEQNIEVCNGIKWIKSSSGANGFNEGSVPYASSEGELVEDNTNLRWNKDEYELTVGKMIKFQGATGSYPITVEASLTSLDELAGVTITDPENGQALVFNGSKWVNGQPTGLWTENGSNIYYNGGNVGIGANTAPSYLLDVTGTARITGATTLSSFTTAGVVTNTAAGLLQTNAFLPVNLGGTGNNATYTSGSVIFSDGTKLTEDNAGLYFNATNNRLGIGTASPNYTLDVAGSLNVTGSGTLRYAGGPDIEFAFPERGNGGRAFVADTSDSLTINYAGDFAGGVNIGGTYETPVNHIGNSGAYTYFNSGNVGIGNAAPSYKLDVTGTTRISGTTTLSSFTTAGVVTNTSGGVIETQAQLPGTMGGVPTGAILMWSGSSASIPAGYALCNGSNGTPDLRDRFIVGAGNSYAVGATGGATTITHSHGGVTGNHTLTIPEIPSHQHVGVTGEANVTGPFGNSGYGGQLGFNRESDRDNTLFLTSAVGGGGAHSHTITSETLENRPPYYSLAYIMKL